MTSQTIARCPSCEGYGWYEDELDGQTVECAWCAGVGYVYLLPDNVQRRIPPKDYPTVADTLEALERERMREMGYTGEAKPPWEQDVRRGTRGGLHPDERDDEPRS